VSGTPKRQSAEAHILQKESNQAIHISFSLGGPKSNSLNLNPLLKAYQCKNQASSWLIVPYEIFVSLVFFLKQARGLASRPDLVSTGVQTEPISKAQIWL